MNRRRAPLRDACPRPATRRRTLGAGARFLRALPISSRSMPRPEPDSSRCPLCGQSNQCAMALGLPPDSCWCMTKRIAPGALEALPADERGQRCICPACGAPGAPSARSGDTA